MPESRSAPVASATETSAELDLRRAIASLTEAELAPEPEERYLAAQLAALRAAAVVLGLRGRPARGSRGRGPRNAWLLLAQVAPELGEWAAFFDLTQSRTEAVRRGGRVTRREADDLVHDAQGFLTLVERLVIRAHRVDVARRRA